MSEIARDHGGGLDAAVAQYGKLRSDWIDLSTGINPVPYPLPKLTPNSWTALPDKAAQDALITAARQFWKIPDQAAVLAAPGASSLIAQMPRLSPGKSVSISGPTYNEHAASFRQAGWHIHDAPPADAMVIVHPNNPTGQYHEAKTLQGSLRIIDESFCDISPDASLIEQAIRPDTIVLKSFGKFWGLAGVRLGFAVGSPQRIQTLKDMLGPWPVAGPALEIGTAALTDATWADKTRSRLHRDSEALDELLGGAGARSLGGTPLFRLYEVEDAAVWQDRLAQHHIWTRKFPYNTRWLRLGLPAPDQWDRLKAALK